MLSGTVFPSAASHADFEAEHRARRANRRRLIVFASTFLLVAIVGLIWVFARPAIYQADARIDFATPSIQRVEAAAPDGGVSNGVGQRPFSVRDEVQYLTSRPLLATVWEKLKTSSLPAPANLSMADPVGSLQAMLSATPVENTRVVVLRARGGEPAFLAAFVDALVEAYQQSLASRYRIASTDEVADLGGEAAKLQDAVNAKRREIDAFRAKHNIVSLERDENQVLSEVKGTATSLNAANEKAVAAEAKLASLERADAAGPLRAKDDPTLAALEQDAAKVRAELREIGRGFTPEYMAIDPRVKALRARLSELEDQIAVQGRNGRSTALAEARADAAGTRAAANALRAQLAANQQAVQAFTSRFNEFQAMQDEVKRLDQLRQKAVERQTALDAESDSRRPQVKVVEGASIPTSPASPWYTRDAALVLLAALLAALATMGIVELFNRAPARPATVVVPQAWTPMPQGGLGVDPAPALGASPRRIGSTAVNDAVAAETRVLAAPIAPLPRDLSKEELDALFDAADADLRPAIALLASGVGPAELVALQADRLDRTAGVLQVDGRRVALPENVLAMLPDGEGPLVADRGGRPFTEATLDARLLYAAHDAGLDAAEEVNAAAVHHTFALHLVRQGIRFSDLAGVVGDLKADRLAAYGRQAPAGPRQGLAAIDPVLPTIRALPV